MLLRRVNAAFTLLELLIVVALIVTLCLLGAAGLQSARAKGDASRCVANLRQISPAFFAYSNDHKNRINLYSEKTGAGTSVQWLRYLVGRADPVLHNRATSGTVYLQNSDAAICPSLSPYRWEKTNNYGYTYGMASPLGDDPYSVAPPGTKPYSREINLSTLDQPAHYWLLTDSYEPTPGRERYRQNFIVYPNLVKPGGVHFRHAGRANVLFADGHVEGLTPAGFKAQPFHPITAGYDSQARPMQF